MARKATSKPGSGNSQSSATIGKIIYDAFRTDFVMANLLFNNSDWLKCNTCPPIQMKARL